MMQNSNLVYSCSPIVYFSIILLLINVTIPVVNCFQIVSLMRSNTSSTQRSGALDATATLTPLSLQHMLRRIQASTLWSSLHLQLLNLLQFLDLPLQLRYLTYRGQRECDPRCPTNKTQNAHSIHIFVFYPYVHLTFKLTAGAD